MSGATPGVLGCLCCIIVVQIIAIAVQAAQKQDVSSQVGSLVFVVLFACCIMKVADRDDDGPQVVVVHRTPETSDGQVNVVSSLVQPCKKRSH